MLASNFIIKNKTQTIIPIFPNELIFDCDNEIEKIIEKEVEIIHKISETYEIIMKLHRVDLTKLQIVCEKKLLNGRKET